MIGSSGTFHQSVTELSFDEAALQEVPFFPVITTEISAGSSGNVSIIAHRDGEEELETREASFSFFDTSLMIAFFPLLESLPRVVSTPL